jgi:hypothetical protein
MEDKFCLIGNSHISQFDNSNLKYLYGYGASICGLYNENSVLQLKTKILHYQNENSNKTLVFFLGQSDMEFIYYFKSIKCNYKIPIDTFINLCIEKYIEFIKTYIKKPIILGINPTVIKNNEHIFNVNFRDKNADGINPAGTNNLQIIYESVKHFYDDYEVRFNNNLIFNKKLKETCEKNNIIYIDLMDEILDKNMKVKDLYQPNHVDHHLVKNYKLYDTLINKIKDFI